MGPAQQASLDRFLVKLTAGAAEEDGQEKDEKVRTGEHPEELERDREDEPLIPRAQVLAAAGSRGTLRSILARGEGCHQAKRARTQLHHLEWQQARQVAAFCTTGQFADASGQAAITAISYNSSLDRVAFVQASGIINIYPVPVLAEEARQLSKRRHGPNASHIPASLTEDADASEQDSDSDYQPKHAAPDDQQDPSLLDQLYSERQRLTRWRARHAQRMQRRIDATSSAVDALPQGGMRLQMGSSAQAYSQLDDVCWEAGTGDSGRGVLAVVGRGMQNVTLLELAEGRRTRHVLQPHPSGLAGGGARAASTFTDVRPFRPAQASTGFRLAAVPAHGGAMHLWGQGATVAAAALRAPPRQQLSGPLEVSPDGRLVYAMTHAGQLLVWDVRKAPAASQRNAAAVMSFGGPPTREDHGLLTTCDVGALLSSAVPSLLYQQEYCLGSAASAAGVKQGLLQPVAGGNSMWRLDSAPSASEQGWLGGGGGVGGLKPRALAPVDHITLDPCDPSRMALVLQDGSAGVLDLGTRGGSLTHLSLSPHWYLAQHEAAATTCNRYQRCRKRGAWHPSGSALWAPQPPLLRTLPAAAASTGAGTSTTRQGSSTITGTSRAGGALGVTLAGAASRVITREGHQGTAQVSSEDTCLAQLVALLQSQQPTTAPVTVPSLPGLGAIDCRPGSISSRAKAGVGRGSAYGGGLAAAGPSSWYGSDDQAGDPGSELSFSDIPIEMRASVGALHEAHQSWQGGSLPLSVAAQVIAVTASSEGAKVLKAAAGAGGSDGSEEALMARLSTALLSEAQSVVAGWAEAVHCPCPHVPVSDWPLCITPAGMFGQHLLAGTAGGQLLVLSDR